MFEKVNPCHPDKVADRIAGAIVDIAYQRQENPKIAVEVLLGHGHCFATVETTAPIMHNDVRAVVQRITGTITHTQSLIVPQDPYLAANQEEGLRCGDNGIFKGVPVTDEEKKMSQIARDIFEKYHTDGKYILDGDKLIICQSHATTEDLLRDYPGAIVNPLGEWTGGPDVDSGATNRKLGSDMAQSLTGGGLHGKDLSKSDVSVNIYAFAKAQETGKTVELSCAIGDAEVGGIPYAEIVKFAGDYIKEIGGFEKFAEWGLV